jgi:hypothetical protein
MLRDTLYFGDKNKVNSIPLPIKTVLDTALLITI